MTTGITQRKSLQLLKPCARVIRADESCLAFQPHRYTRTHDLIDDFSKALSIADALLVTEV